MPLADLTLSRAVDQALDEFDRMGRSAFLDKYRFGKAREYFVSRSGRLYDSKAIAGAAYGYQFPERGALRPEDFNGGDATVRQKLEQLGFDVVRVRESPAAGAALAAVSEREKAFHRRMLEAYKAAKEIGYNATRFVGMLSERGGIETAHILLGAPTISEGYAALWERGRLDLTVEAIVLEGPWDDLFSPAERQIAIRRLRDHQFSESLPQA